LFFFETQCNAVKKKVLPTNEDEMGSVNTAV